MDGFGGASAGSDGALQFSALRRRNAGDGVPYGGGSPCRHCQRKRLPLEGKLSAKLTDEVGGRQLLPPMHCGEFVLRQDLIRPCGFAWGHLKVNCPKGKRGHPGVSPEGKALEFLIQISVIGFSKQEDNAHNAASMSF